MKKTALVTGGAGFLGSNLCARLLKDGYRVVALDNLYTGSRKNLSAFADNPDFAFVEADVTDLDAKTFGQKLQASAPDFGFQISDFRFQSAAHPAPSAAHPAPSAAHPAPSAAYPAPSAEHCAPGAEHCAPGAAHPAPSAAHPAPSAAHPAPSAAHCAPGAEHCAPGTEHCAPGTEHFSEIYNLACPASPPHYQARPVFTTLTSIKGILFCLELARRDGAKLLHTSTSEVYGDALVHPQPEGYWGNVNTIGIRSCYDEGKRVAETLVADYVRAYDVDARMVRIFNTYGPMMNPEDGRVVSNFICQALRGEDLTVYGEGRQTRSFQFCDDLIDAFRAYMELPKARMREFFRAPRPVVPVVNTGNPGEFTMLELAQEVLRQIPGTGSKLVFRPLPSDDPKQRKPDILLAKELLGWEPKVPLAEGLAKTISYFKSQISEV
jgi:UDP-glucuronate decarboxylase